MTFLGGTLFGLVLSFGGFVLLTAYAPITLMTKFLVAVEWFASKLPRRTEPF